MPLIHKGNPLRTGEPSALQSITHFLFLNGWGFAWSEPPPLQRIPHFRIFSFALRVGLLEAVEGAVDTAVC